MGFTTKKNGIIALLVLVGAYLLGVFNKMGMAIESSEFPFLGIKTQYVMAFIVGILLWLTYDTFGTR